uniref:CMRF35-like molecule 8 n=1 Tax=Bos indicus x Bos taurus TaxID=30522 RepID=A0A4W2HBR1_BOBOX
KVLGGWWESQWASPSLICISAPAAPPTPRPTRPTVTAKTSTVTTKVSTVSFTTLATEGTTHSASSQEEYDPTQTWWLHALLISLALLLLLLGGISLLAWRMVQRRVKAGEKPEPPQSCSQAAEQTELCYANLELQTWPLSGKPVQPTQAEVEYSTVDEDTQKTSQVLGTSLAVQWLRLSLPMQGVQV